MIDSPAPPSHTFEQAPNVIDFAAARLRLRGLGKSVVSYTGGEGKILPFLRRATQKLSPESTISPTLQLLPEALRPQVSTWLQKIMDDHGRGAYFSSLLDVERSVQDNPKITLHEFRRVIWGDKLL